MHIVIKSYSLGRINGLDCNF